MILTAMRYARHMLQRQRALTPRDALRRDMLARVDAQKSEESLLQQRTGDVPPRYDDALQRGDDAGDG